MSVRAPRLARLGGVLLLLIAAGARPAAAQRLVELIVPRAERFPAVPQIPARAVGFPRDQYPLSLLLEISESPAFGRSIPYIARNTDSTVFIPPRALPNQTALYFRVRVLNRFGSVIGTSEVIGPRTTTWLELITPVTGVNVNIHTRFPRFTWQSAPAAIPVGPWLFTLSVVNTATGVEEFRTPEIADTTVEIPAGGRPLEVQTPYRWSVRARLLGSPADSLTLVSSTFVVRSPTSPLAVLLYQNFPNPFPSAQHHETCIWFDLPRTSTVRLTVHDLRGNLVRTLVPGPTGDLPGELPPGAYGRGGELQASGCDYRLQWDGTDQTGRVVPSGVYLLRLQAGSEVAVRKMLFRGP